MSKIIFAFAVLFLAQCALAGYDQWISLIIENHRNEPIRVTGSLSWGKWYTDGDKSKEVGSPNIVLQKGDKTYVAVTGRSDSPSGAEGHIYITSEVSKKQLVNFYFSCPYIGENKVIVTNKDLFGTSTVNTPWRQNGPLGEMILVIYQH